MGTITSIDPRKSKRTGGIPFEIEGTDLIINDTISLVMDYRLNDNRQDWIRYYGPGFMQNHIVKDFPFYKAEYKLKIWPGAYIGLDFTFRLVYFSDPRIVKELRKIHE